MMRAANALFAGAVLASCGSQSASSPPPESRVVRRSVVAVETARDPDTEEKPQPSPPPPSRARCPAASRAPDDAAGVTNLREVDWCNHDYGVVTLRDGAGEVSGAGRPGEPASTAYDFVRVIYGDLEWRGHEEAVVLLTQTFRDANGKTWYGAELFAFALRDGEVVPMGNAPASHVADGMLTIDDGLLTWSYARDDLLCSEYFRLRVGSLAYVGHDCGQ